MAETLYFDLKESFFTEKRLKISNNQSAQKLLKRCTKKGTKVSFILQTLKSIKTRFYCFISLLFIISELQGFSDYQQPFSKFSRFYFTL